MRRRIAVVLPVFVALTLAVTGCGGDERPSAEEWADGVCSAISSYETELTRIRDQLANPASLNQDGLEEAANDASAATETLVDDLRSLGAPETESGEAARQAIDNLATTVEDDFAEIEAAADGVSDITEVPTAITAISASLASITSALSSTIPTIQNVDVEGDLRAAFEQSSACDTLTASS